MIHSRTPYDCEHAVSIAHRIVQPLQNNNPAPFTPHITVRSGIERTATAARRQCPNLAEVDRAFRCEQKVDTACKRKIALALTEIFDSKIECHERGRASRIQRKTWATQPEDERQASGHDAEGIACARVGVYLRSAGAHHELGIIIGTDADKNPAAGACK